MICSQSWIMDKKELILHMIAVADGLDELGLSREAQLIDHIAGKVKEIYKDQPAQKTKQEQPASEHMKHFKQNTDGKKPQSQVDPELYEMVYDLLGQVMINYRDSLFDGWDAEGLQKFKDDFVKDILHNVPRIDESQLADFLITVDKTIKELLDQMNED